MSEKQPNGSPDRKKGPHYVEGLPDALQIEAIDRLRNDQAIYEGDQVFKLPYDDFEGQERAREAAYKHFDQMIKDHLVASGIPEDDPRFKEYADLLHEYSVDKISHTAWNAGEVQDDGSVGPSPRSQMVAVLREKYESAPTAPPPDNPPPVDDDPTKANDPPIDIPKTPEEVQEIIDKGPHARNLKVLESSLDHWRQELAKLSAKRQGRLWTKEGGKLDEDYKQVETTYNKVLTDLMKLRLQAEKEAGLVRTEEDERLDVAQRLIQHFHDLQEESVDRLKNSKVGGFVTWMTKGGTAKRLMKGALIGGGFGLVGAAVTAFTGGAGLGVAAGAVTVAARAAALARGFAMFDNRQGRGMDVVDAGDRTSSFNVSTIEEAGAGEKSGEETVDLLHQHLMGKLEADTKKEQNKRRWALGKSLGVVAVGAALVEGVHVGVDMYHNLSTPDVHTAGPTGADVPPSTGEAPLPSTPPLEAPSFEYAPEAMSISSGEGWYQTFQDMGIPQKDWSTLLEQAGPKLHDIQVGGHPLAYQMPDGQWGIRMTPDGMMPKEALDAITQTHDHMTGVADMASTPSAPGHIEVPDTSGPSGVPQAAELAPNGAPSPESIQALTAPVDHAGIENVIKMDVIQPSDVANNTQLDHLTHVATWLSPDTFAQRLGLPSYDWLQLQDHIASEVTQQHNPLYTGVFDVTPNGYLRFITSDIPDATMADMLNHIPPQVRAGL